MLRKRSFWLNIFTASLIAGYVATIFMAIDGTNGLLTLCLLFAVIANIDLFKLLKIGTGGITAEAREVLQRTEDRLKEIRELAKLTAQTSLSLVVRSGRWGGLGPEVEEEMKDKMLAHLGELGVPDSELDTLLSDYHRYAIFDYAELAIKGTPTGLSLSPEEDTTWKDFRNFSPDKPPSPEELERNLLKFNFMTDGRREIIEAYRHYLIHYRHKDPEKWIAWKVPRT